MKIKKLIIRNIASIEHGEIDFENGLKDVETGRASALFLITGDTGSGKSAILDCISMALYGTTPRVKGVNGQRSNKFRTGNGEEISINNIAQYTRIGIAAKDDCYSELYFRGNDSVDYISRFSLGMTTHKNLRKPAWKLTIGDTEVIDDRKDEIKERIQNAVGLSFEQFSRMAMLAQGQFAEFLTGDKDVREKILEQLTATDIFSRYGDAIFNIFRRAKQEKEMSVKIYEEFAKRILSEDTRLLLMSELEEKNAMSADSNAELDKLRKRISFTEAVVKIEKDLSHLQAEAVRLKAIEDTPEFGKKTAIIKLWDETAAQRELLSDKIKALDNIDEDTKKLRKKKTELLAYSSDLDMRSKEAYAQAAMLEAERKWIEEKEPHKMIFSEAAVTIHKIHNLESLEKERLQKEKESKEGNVIIVKLLQSIGQQEKDVKHASDNCVRCQESITQKSVERDALKPAELRGENKRLLSRTHALNDLAKCLSQLVTEKEEMAKAESETLVLTQLHTELKTKSDSDSAVCSRAEKDMKDAEARYLTMHLSIDENFRELRRRLSAENASICPLCGQTISDHLHEWADEGYFSSILSPLEDEKAKLEEKYVKAKAAADESSKNLNTTAGRLKEKQKDLRKKKSVLAGREDEISASKKALEISDSMDPSAAITVDLLKIKNECERISGSLAMADSLQNEIDALLKQKSTIDKTLKEAETKLHKLKEELTDIKATVRNADERQIELKKETQLLKKEISDILQGYAPDWHENPLDSASRLKKEADEYAKRTDKFSKDEFELRTLLKILDSLKDTEKTLAKQMESIETSDAKAASEDFKSMRLEALQKKWNELLIETSAITTRNTDNVSKIKTIDNQLNEYYQAYGKTETTIRQILGAADEVNEARIAIQKHRDEAGRVAILLSEATKDRDENMSALSIENPAELEDIEMLKTNLLEKEKQYAELSQRLGVIKERLEADSKTRQDSERQRLDLERKTLRHEKWDKMNKYFGGTRFRTLVQSYILRPLLDNANIYLRRITDHYTLTCSDENEQLSILVLDRYNNNEPRSATVLSGGERFMISLALSLALSSMNRPDLNVDILFIDEGFGTLDAKSLDMVMATLRRLHEINGQTGRRVGVISHREELTEQIPCQIQLRRCGEGRSRIVIP